MRDSASRLEDKAGGGGSDSGGVGGPASRLTNIRITLVVKTDFMYYMNKKTLFAAVKYFLNLATSAIFTRTLSAYLLRYTSQMPTRMQGKHRPVWGFFVCLC